MINIKELREKVLCPTFWVMTAFIMLIIAHAIWYNKYYKNNDYYHNSYLSDVIKEKMTGQAMLCGSNSFFSWIVIDSKSKNRFRFGDVLATNGVGVFSVKNTNNYYQKEQHLSKDTYQFISNYPSGFANYYSDLSEIKIDEVRNIIAEASNELVAGAFSVAKNNQKDVVYVFLYSKRDGYSPCNKQEIVDFLQKMSFDIEFILK